MLEPLAFLKRLATLIPPPRQNLITYRGCFAPNARLRKAVVGLCPVPEDDEPEKAAATAQESTDELSPEENVMPPRRRLPWAQLLKRVFHNDLLVCGKCHGKRKVIAFVTERQPITQILTHLGLPTEPPTVAPARAPPQTEMFDDGWATGGHATDPPGSPGSAAPLQDGQDGQRHRSAQTTKSHILCVQHATFREPDKPWQLAPSQSIPPARTESQL